MHMPEGLYGLWRCTDRNEAGTMASNVLRVFGRDRREPSSSSSAAAAWDPDDYMHSYDSDDYDDATYFQLQPKRVLPQQQVMRMLFETSADRKKLRTSRIRKKELEAEIAEINPAVALLLFIWRSFWFRFVRLWQTVRVTPLETYRAVSITSSAAKDVVTDMVSDSVQQARHAVEEARAVAERSRAKAELMEDRPCPDDFWGKVQWWWERPPLKRMRTTVSMAQWSVKLPALLALVATQVGLLASQVSLPMLAPLLLGTGMLFRSIKSNASFLFPRIGLVVVLLWVLWFANSVIQNTVHYLQRQGALDHRISAAVITGSELFTMLGAGVIVLSALGVNVSGLLLPAGVCLAIAAKDLAHNFLAGFFLFAVQPFRLGDRIAVRSMASGESAAASPGPTGGWYTIIKNGRQRLYMPNSKFLTSEFMVLDGQKHKRGFGPRHSEPPGTGMRPGMTRPLGPGMAYGRWGEELERQRITAASRRTAPAGKPSNGQGQPTSDSQGPGQAQAPGTEQANSNGYGNGSGRHVPDAQGVNGDPNMQGAHQNGAQHQEPPPGFVHPYRGIPGYYSYGAYPGPQYDPAVQDQYLYQYNYNGLHPYWRNAYMRDNDESWDEHNPSE
ncbi:MAG: hypothetical protein FRX49_05597 [Trebouxia sp. A1-2]|nr:MAG: hypothetical protein FRX49_05597 [Trebouxia sp. A1-2]